MTRRVRDGATPRTLPGRILALWLCLRREPEFRNLRDAIALWRGRANRSGMFPDGGYMLPHRFESHIRRLVDWKPR